MDVKNEAFLPLFAEVKELLAPYAGRLTVRKDEPGYFDLWSEKDIEVDGRRRNGRVLLRPHHPEELRGFLLHAAVRRPGAVAGVRTRPAGAS